MTLPSGGPEKIPSLLSISLLYLCSREGSPPYIYPIGPRLLNTSSTMMVPYTTAITTTGLDSYPLLLVPLLVRLLLLLLLPAPGASDRNESSSIIGIKKGRWAALKNKTLAGLSTRIYVTLIQCGNSCPNSSLWNGGGDEEIKRKSLWWWWRGGSCW